MFKVVIVGSKGFDDYALMEQYVDTKLSRISQEDTIEIATSYARSVVIMATRYAQEHNYQHRHFQPQPGKYYYQAYQRVDEELLDYADSIIIFWNGGPGAAEKMINKAKEANVRVAVKRVELPGEAKPKRWPFNLLADASVEATGEVSEERLNQAFAVIKLKDRIRDILYQRYRDGMSLQEIGDQLDITSERVRQLVRKGTGIINSRRMDFSSILETGTLQKLKPEIPLSSTSMRKKYVDTLAALGIYSIGDLRATSDYQKFSSGEPILITKEWVTETGIPIYSLKWLLTQEGMER